MLSVLDTSCSTPRQGMLDSAMVALRFKLRPARYGSQTGKPLEKLQVDCSSSHWALRKRIGEAIEGSSDIAQLEPVRLFTVTGEGACVDEGVVASNAGRSMTPWMGASAALGA